MIFHVGSTFVFAKPEDREIDLLSFPVVHQPPFHTVVFGHVSTMLTLEDTIFAKRVFEKHSANDMVLKHIRAYLEVDKMHPKGPDSLDSAELLWLDTLPEKMITALAERSIEIKEKQLSGDNFDDLYSIFENARGVVWMAQSDYGSVKALTILRPDYLTRLEVYGDPDVAVRVPNEPIVSPFYGRDQPQPIVERVSRVGMR